MCSVALFNERVSAIQAVGYVINILGFVYYQIIKSREDISALNAEAEQSVEPLLGSSGTKITREGDDEGMTKPLRRTAWQSYGHLSSYGFSGLPYTGREPVYNVEK